MDINFQASLVWSLEFVCWTFWGSAACRTLTHSDWVSKVCLSMFLKMTLTHFFFFVSLGVFLFSILLISTFSPLLLAASENVLFLDELLHVKHGPWVGNRSWPSSLLRNCLVSKLQLTENVFLYQSKSNPVTLKSLKQFLKAVPQEQPPQNKALKYSVRRLVEWLRKYEAEIAQPVCVMLFWLH